MPFMVIKGRVQDDFLSPKRMKCSKVMLSLLSCNFGGSVEKLNWDQYDCKVMHLHFDVAGGQGL